MIPFARIAILDPTLLKSYPIRSNLVAFPMSFAWCLLRNCAKEMRLLVGRRFFTMVQYSSLCEGAAVIYLGIGEAVLGRVQIEWWREEVNDGEKQEKDKHEETDNERSWMAWSWTSTCTETLSQDVAKTCARCMRKMTCEVSVYTHVGHSGSPSTANETNCIQKKKNSFKTNLMSSIPIPFRLVPPRCVSRGMPSLVLFWRSGLFNFSLDSWCKRFFIETAARKSDRSFTSLLLLWLVLGEIPSSLVSPLFLWSEMICMVLFLQFYLTLCTCSVHPIVSCDSR